MPTTDPIVILLAHDRWATRVSLEACKALSQEQFHRRFEIGPGSLHDCLTHLLGAMRRWGDLLAGRDQRPPLEGEDRNCEQLLGLLDEIADDLEASARAHPSDGMVTGSRDGRTYTLARSGVLAHVATHGMHHRAQCLNMMRQLGVDPLPPSSVVEWIMMVDATGQTTS